MVTICSRCQFQVALKHRACQVCGCHDLIQATVMSASEMRQESLAAWWRATSKLIVSAGEKLKRIQQSSPMFGTSRDNSLPTFVADIRDTTKKCQSAMHKIIALIACKPEVHSDKAEVHRSNAEAQRNIADVHSNNAHRNIDDARSDENFSNKPLLKTKSHRTHMQLVAPSVANSNCESKVSDMSFA